MFDLENKDEEAAFYELDSDRGVAIIATAIVENRLTDLLKAAMKHDEETFKELFRPGGALGDFGNKIKLAYLLGLIHEDVQRDLSRVAKIRNAFAHRVSIKSFDDQSIKDSVQNLNALKLWAAALDKVEKQIKQDGSTDRDVRLSAQILRGELSTVRDSFRMCLRLYIQKLIVTEKTVKNWSANRPAPEPEGEVQL
jgi:DNA-binding MltR family transcriptional regulator